MIRVRSLRDGSVIPLPPGCSIEITDQQGRVAVLFLHDAEQSSVQVVTQQDEPDMAHNYTASFGVQFSPVLKPDLSKLAPAPPPTPFQR